MTLNYFQIFVEFRVILNDDRPVLSATVLYHTDWMYSFGNEFVRCIVDRVKKDYGVNIRSGMTSIIKY